MFVILTCHVVVFRVHVHTSHIMSSLQTLTTCNHKDVTHFLGVKLTENSKQCLLFSHVMWWFLGYMFTPVTSCRASTCILCGPECMRQGKGGYIAGDNHISPVAVVCPFTHTHTNYMMQRVCG